MNLRAYVCATDERNFREENFLCNDVGFEELIAEYVKLFDEIKQQETRDWDEIAEMVVLFDVIYCGRVETLV